MRSGTYSFRSSFNMISRENPNCLVFCHQDLWVSSETISETPLRGVFIYWEGSHPAALFLHRPESYFLQQSVPYRNFSTTKSNRLPNGFLLETLSLPMAESFSVLIITEKYQTRKQFFRKFCVLFVPQMCTF